MHKIKISESGLHNPIIYNYNFQMGFSDVDSENKPVSFQQTCEAKRSIHLQELQQKEDEMRQMFVARVKEKEAELKEAEKEVIVFIIFNVSVEDPYNNFIFVCIVPSFITNSIN